MSITPAGWYDDGHGAQRWWDGARWTEHVQDAAAPPSAVPGAAGYPSAAQVPAPPSVVPSGAQVPPQPPTPSRGWIVPVILGAALVVLIILALVFIPPFVRGFEAATQSPQEKAAVAAVELYDEAWDKADCDKFDAATTQALRDSLRYSTCDEFTAGAQSYADNTDDYKVEVTSVESDATTVTVMTKETYTSYLDDKNNEVPGGMDATDVYTYTVIEDQGAWVIDDISLK